MSSQATTPQAPYYAVIFTSIRNDNLEAYEETLNELLALAAQQSGYLGFESARQTIGISVSYWSSLDAIKVWKENSRHRHAQMKAKDWYQSFRVRVCRVEHEYGF